MSEEFYIKMADNNYHGQYWFGLSEPLGNDYILKRGGTIVKLPPLTKEVEILNFKNQKVKTTVGDIVDNAEKRGIIEVIDKDKKQQIESFQKQVEKMRKKVNEQKEKARVQKFLDVLKQPADKVIELISEMVEKFSSNPNLVIANLKFFKELEEDGKNKNNKTRTTVIEHIEKTLNQFIVNEDISQYKDPKTGEISEDIIEVKGINSVNKDD